MNAAWVCLAGLAVFAFGYFVYSKHLARRVFALSDDEEVPSRKYEDGHDYVPTPRAILFGHHYASIAGAAPIIGPAIAIIWGWVPALLWVVLGTVFMGAVHDFSTLVLSLRHDGRSVGQVTARVIGPRTRTLFLLVIFFLIFMVIAVFAKAIATLFIAKPGTVIPINFEIVVALAIGWYAHRKGAKLLVPSILALVSLYAMVWVGVKVPVSLEGLFGSHTRDAWVVFLLAYSFVASILPVWVLLHPRDYINSHQLLVGLAALVLGVLVAQPQITAPAFNAAEDGPFWFPFLFVTIACGAISGFHGLVSSGTTSKQIACATDARAIGYGGMLGEGLLALVSTLAVSAGLSNWAGHYESWAVAAGHGVANFVEGAGSFLVGLGLPRGPSEVVVAVLVVSFAATSLDTGVRIQRYILEELGSIWQVGLLQNRYVASAIAVLLPLLLYLSGGEGAIWPLFGTSNQLLAGLSLTLVTVWLYRTGRPWIYTGIPMVVVLTISSLAMFLEVRRYLFEGKYLLLLIGGIILALQIWVVGEAIAAVRRTRKAAAVA
ncbi:MAG: carbon starvation protein A [Deltaproteobacteria bacterium]|nr:MAG: carbon starvation protein A [Deltaproteobacteria bacterium]